MELLCHRWHAAVQRLRDLADKGRVYMEQRDFCKTNSSVLFMYRCFPTPGACRCATPRPLRNVGVVHTLDVMEQFYW